MPHADNGQEFCLMNKLLKSSARIKRVRELTMGRCEIEYQLDALHIRPPRGRNTFYSLYIADHLLLNAREPTTGLLCREAVALATSP